MKCVSSKIVFQEILYQEMLFHKIQENYDEEKSGKPRSLIIFVGRIIRKELLDISEE